MTFLTPFVTALALSTQSPALECSLRAGTPSEQRVFTNADLERMAACRSQTGAQSEATVHLSDPPARTRQRSAAGAPDERQRRDASEADWRARWRSIDQRARKLRRDASELRQEARDLPRDPKKAPTGRRSPALLLTRARALETEAKELEEEFQDRARREGALPGWLRAKSR